MKKKLITLLLVLTITCSALFGFVGCNFQSVTSIEFNNMPKNEYTVGEEINANTFTVTLKFNNETNQEVNLDDERLTVTGLVDGKLDTSTPGTKTITVKYNKFTIQATYTVKESEFDPEADNVLQINPSETITAALARLKADSTKDTLYLPNGTYAGFTVTDENVTIIGQSITGVEIGVINVKAINFKISNVTLTALAGRLTTENPVSYHSISGLTVVDCAFDGNGYATGFSIAAMTASAQYANNAQFTSNMLIKNCTFKNYSSKGIYVEAADDLRIEGCSFTNITMGGQFITTNANVYNNAFAIDINLKYTSYSSISILNCYFGQNASNNLFGGAIAIKERGTGDDSPSNYGLSPASIESVVVANCIFSGNQRDLVLGESGSGNDSLTHKVIMTNLINASIIDYTAEDENDRTTISIDRNCSVRGLLSNDGSLYYSYNTGTGEYTTSETKNAGSNAKQNTMIYVRSGATLTIDGSNNQLWLVNNMHIVVEEGGTLLITKGEGSTAFSGGVLKIGADCSLTIKDGGTVTVNNGGQIIEDGGQITIEEGATDNRS